MIGQALVVAWSFTISSLSTTPQIIDIGAAPTNSDYTPVAMGVRYQNIDSKYGVQSYSLTVGSNPKNPGSPPYSVMGITADTPEWGNWHATYDIKSFFIVPAGHDLYAEFQSFKTDFPAQDLPIHVDILAYPSDNDLYCPSAISSSDNGATGIPSNFYINSGAAIPGETYHFTAANITISKQAIGTCQYKSQAGNLLGLGIKTKVTVDRGHPYNKWKLISYQDLGCFHNTNNCPFSQD